MASSENKSKYWKKQPVERTIVTTTTTEETAKRKAGPIYTGEQLTRHAQLTSAAQPDQMVQAGLEFVELDRLAPNDTAGVQAFLAANYVGWANFRYEYTTKFLQWALSPPGNVKTLLVGVRYMAEGVKRPCAECKSEKAKACANCKQTFYCSRECQVAGWPKHKFFCKHRQDELKKASTQPKEHKTEMHDLVGFISAVCYDMQAETKTTQNMAVINFLCVHKVHRRANLAGVLIDRIKLLMIRKGVYYAVYTSGSQLPVPNLCEARYFHRDLNVEKCLDTGFSFVRSHETRDEMIQRYALPECLDPRLVPMEEAHVDSAMKLLNTFLEKHDINPILNAEQFRHYYLPKDGVIQTYVALEVNEEGNDDAVQVSDFFSFYITPIRYLGDRTANRLPEDTMVVAACVSYVVNNSFTMQELLHQACIAAKLAGGDVFNALRLMNLSEKDLRSTLFNQGSGVLKYYMYNWSTTRRFEPDEVALILY